MVEPSGTGMALFTLRAASEVRAPQFGSAEGNLDAEMVAIAGATVIRRPFRPEYLSRTGRRHREARTPFVRVDELCAGAPFTWTKTGFEGEIGFGGFEHLVVPSSPSPATTRSVGTIAFVGKANAQKADESGFPDKAENFPDRPI